MIYPFFRSWPNSREPLMWIIAVRMLWDIGWHCMYNYKKHFPAPAMGPTFHPLFNIHSSWMQSSAIHPSAWTRLSDVLTACLSASIINTRVPITEVFKMVIHKRFAQNLPNFGDWHFTECVCNLFFLPLDSMFRQFDSLQNAQNGRRVTNGSPLQVSLLFIVRRLTAPCPLE